MLEPDSRFLLLDALRPPAAFSLDQAVGTTFSLDLHSLLIVPLAFALFDADTREGRPDPIALLEAVRRHAARIDVFCQAGQIALPGGRYERVLTYVEQSVHQVVPDAAHHVFHPKVWVLRFRDGVGALRYRVLCLSRNLTFDRSWDTILLLEGVPVGTRRPQNGRRLGDFVRALVDLRPHAVGGERRSAILGLADELTRVAFHPPEPFEEADFVPLGIRRYRRSSLPLDGDQLRLAVSPFLGTRLAAGFGSSSRVTLVSRVESLDALPAADLDRFDAYTVSAEALGPLDDDAEAVEAPSELAAERAGCPLRGLHAKLYVAERGWHARVWTGSANATAAAFGGNVELLVELRGRRSKCGSDALLGGRGLSFGTLLEPYQRTLDEPRATSTEDLLQERLDDLRHELAAARFTATAEASTGGQTFRLRLDAQAPEDLPDAARGRVWPISLTDDRALPLSAALGGGADFGEVSLDAVTSFFAIELSLREGDITAAARFVINADLRGVPENRGDRLLSRLLESREKVLRYLLLLLAADGLAADGSGPVARLIEALDHTNGWKDAVTVPLLESLVRTLARDPDRLDHVARLFESLRSTEEGASLLPEGFEEIWKPIWETRTGSR